MKLRCPRCHGLGKVELESLSTAHRECLKVLSNLGTATPEQVHVASRTKLGLTATHHRLYRLAKLGLVKQVGVSRPARWKVA